MPDSEERGEVTGRDAGRKTEDGSVAHVHPEEHPEIGLKGGRRVIEQRDEDDQAIVNDTTVIND